MDVYVWGKIWRNCPYMARNFELEIFVNSGLFRILPGQFNIKSHYPFLFNKKIKKEAILIYKQNRGKPRNIISRKIRLSIYKKVIWARDGLGVNDAESASGHEDDALFGDLFLEASRQVVIFDGHEQPCSANDSVFDSSNIPLQGVGALPWSPKLGGDKLLEIEYFISFSRILRHNVHFGHTRELS